jgi:hypothetical protein
MTKDLLDIYSDFLIAQSQYATATSLSNLLEGSISHDWQYVKPKVRQQELDQEGVLIIDDTIEEKPYTDENTIVNWYFFHAKGQVPQRHQFAFMTCTIW